MKTKTRCARVTVYMESGQVYLVRVKRGLSLRNARCIRGREMRHGKHPYWMAAHGAELTTPGLSS